ncbi:MAG: gamma carbonic anhydrase family protein [Alphaproteobacteria bacterium]|nr:gamma carbonic anhydrase family protein [Alphaproteobacteria bacterium]
MNPIILPYKGIMPTIDPTAFIAPGAVVVGDVHIGAHSSVWFGCVLRGDVNVIRVGARTNIQDGTIVHVTHGGQGTHIGDDVTIGHMVVLHDCTLDNHSFIGMKAMVIDRARVESLAMVGAGAFVTQNKIVPSKQLWVGNPAKYWRDLKEEEIAEIKHRAVHYVNVTAEYIGQNGPLVK